MATFSFQLKSGGKGTAVGHAGYIARDGFHGKRGDLVHTDHGNLPAWTGGDPRALWRAADRFERKNGAAYREAVIALPSELTAVQSKALASDLIGLLAKGKPYQSAIHAPTSSLEGQKNPHLHVMICDRADDGIERPAEQFFRRYNGQDPEAGGRRKATGGLNRMQLRDSVISTRKDVADTINQHLEANGHKARVDHRTLQDQGIKRKAERHLGQARIRNMSPEEKATYRVMRKIATRESS